METKKTGVLSNSTAMSTQLNDAAQHVDHLALGQNPEYRRLELEAQNAELVQMRLILEESRRRYLDFYKLAPVGFCTIDRQGAVIENNLAMSRMLNLPAGTLVGQKLPVWMHPDDRDAYCTLLQEVVDGNAEAVSELKLLTKAGTLCWVRVTGKLDYGGDGTPEIQLVFCDLSRKKNALAALSNQEAQNRALERAIPDAIFSFRRGDSALRPYGSAASAGSAGSAAGDGGDALRNSLPTAIMQGFKHAAEVALSTDVIQELRYELESSEHQQRYFEARVAPSIDQTVVIVVRDVTERESARHEREQQFLSSLSAIDAERTDMLRHMTMAGQMVRMGTWTRAPDSQYYSVSEHWCALFGFDPTERVSIAAVCQRIHCADLGDPSHPLRCGPASAGEHYHELRVRLPDLGERWVGLFHQAELDHRGQVKLWRGVSLDITKNKRAELELQQKRMEVLYLGRVSMMGALSGALAHELNQPLTSILCNAQAAKFGLERDRLTLPALQEILQEIIDADTRAGAMIHRLRRLFYKGEPQLVRLALDEMVQDALDILRNDLINHGWNVNLEPSTTRWMVMADAVQIQQVMINLLMNACEAGVEAGVVEGRIVVRIIQTSPGWVEVQVSDNGPGIAAELLHNLFDSFRTTKRQGMGLGLSICHSIIASHNGHLRAENNPQRGARLVFSLPLCTE